MIVPFATVQTIDEEMLDHYWKCCTDIIEPGGHSTQDVVERPEENWDLELLLSGDRQMTVQQANIAINKFPDQYGTPGIFQKVEDEKAKQRIKKGHIRQEAAEGATDE